MTETNGYVKWSVLRWIVGGICLAFLTLSGYVITNDTKRECDKDMFTVKLDKIQEGISAIRIDIGPYMKQIEVNTIRLDKLEDRGK